MTRLTSDLSPGDTGRIEHYNDLRTEAKASSYLFAFEQSTPDLTLKVSPGQIYFGSTLVEFAGGNSPSFTAPTTNPRIDILSINDSGTLVRTAGDEDASPSAPSVPAGEIPIAQVYNRVGQTSIKDEDDSSNGYIQKDLRPFLNTTGAYDRFKSLSNTVVDNNADVKSSGSESYTKVKETRLDEDVDLLRVRYQARRVTGSPVTVYYANARLYINGSAVGTERDLGSSFITYTDDIVSGLSAGDLIQVYVQSNASTSITIEVKELQICYTSEITHIEGKELITPIEYLDTLKVTQLA